MAAPRRPRPDVFVVSGVRHSIFLRRDPLDAHNPPPRRFFRSLSQVASRTIMVRANLSRRYTHGRYLDSSVGGLEASHPFLGFAVIDAKWRHLAPMGSSNCWGRC